MDSNMSLVIGFKGAGALNGVPVFNHQLPLTIGGVIDPAETVDPNFGRVASVIAASPNSLRVGIPATAVPIGVYIFDPAIAQNDLAMNNKYFPGGMASVMTFGQLQLATWTKTGAGTIDPVRGCKVIVEDATGNIEFVGSATAVPANFTQLKACVVTDDLLANRVTIFLGVTGSLTV